jgi:ADP-ribose pyrophosphatase
MSFSLLSESIAYQNPFFTVLDRLYRLPDGSEHHFYVMKEVDTCCVLAMTKDKQFVTVKEFRVGPGKIMIELPAGRLETPEGNPDEQIKQELLQETGYAGDFKKIGTMPTSPYSTRFIHCYYAVNCEKIAEQTLDKTEFIDVAILNLEEMEQVLSRGESSSCAPGLLAWEWLKKDGFMKN